MQDRQVPRDVFVGRAEELAQLADVIARVRTGQPWLVTIEGDPGVGKSSLAREGLAGAPGVRVLPVRATQADTDLDFGLACQLLEAAGDDRPPGFATSREGAPVSPFAVGAQLLDVIGELASSGPLALVVDDLQWSDRKSIQAMTFMLRRLSVEPVLAVVIYRRPSDRLDQAARQFLASVDNRLLISLGTLGREDVAALAAAVRGPLDEKAVERLYAGTAGHPLYLRTVLAEAQGSVAGNAVPLALPQSLATAIGDQLRTLPPETRDTLEALAVLNQRLPLAQLGQATRSASPSAAIEPAVATGLADWAPEEPSCPVGLRHLLIRDAIYAALDPARRRALHARAALMVSESASWEHRVAALDGPDEDLAAELERLAEQEAAEGHLALAATHLQWASEISPGETDRERRLLTAALRLMIAEESRGMALRPAVEAAEPSPLRGCVLGAMALFSGQLAEAEQRFAEALAQAQADPGRRPLAAQIASWVSGNYLIMGNGEKALASARWALNSHDLDPLAASWTQAQVVLGALQVMGPPGALAELGHLDPDPARVAPLDAQCLALRGVVRMTAGDLGRAVTDSSTALTMMRQGAPFSLGLQPFVFLVLAQYLAGRWDEALLTSEQLFSAISIRPRHYELPLLHLAAACVPAGRGQATEAGEHAEAAGEAAAAMDSPGEGLWAAMARALIAQAAADYPGITGAFRPFLDDPPRDSRSRALAVLWRPLLAEGLIGAGQTGPAGAVLDQLRAQAGQVGWLQPALAWLQGWLAEQNGDTGQALEIYTRGELTADGASPVHMARLLLAHGRLLRQTGQRRPAIERLRRANDIYLSLRAAPFLARTGQELAACHLRVDNSQEQTVLALTSRESEVTHLVGKGLTNREIAAELFLSRKAVEYHLGNLYAKCGVQGRQQLQRFAEQWQQPVVI